MLAVIHVLCAADQAVSAEHFQLTSLLKLQSAVSGSRGFQSKDTLLGSSPGLLLASAPSRPLTRTQSPTAQASPQTAGMFPQQGSDPAERKRPSNDAMAALSPVSRQCTIISAVFCSILEVSR